MKMNKVRRKKNINKNQKSFYFKDYLETNQNFRNKKISHFYRQNISSIFLFFSLISIFAFKIVIVSIQSSNFSETVNVKSNFVF